MRFVLLPAVLLACSGLAQTEILDVGTGLNTVVDTQLTGVARRYWEERARALAAIRTATDLRSRQAWARSTFLQLLGGLPEKTPLNARITGTLERDGYRVEKLIFESQPGFHVTANVYVPKSTAGPYPAILGTAGHSDTGKAQWNYQRAWIGMAKRGFLVLAYDPPGQGERVEAFDPDLGTSRIGVGVAEHNAVGLQCMLTGTSLARYIVWDGIRAVDYLLTRKDVDPTRLAVAGNSGGGTQSAYLALAEPRLAAAAPSCYMTSWEKLWFEPGPQDAEQSVPGFLSSGLGMGDFGIGFAPRPFLMLTATRDFFPIAGAKSTFGEIRQVYETAGRAEAAGFFEYDDGHGWSQPRREATYRWFERWLHGREDGGAEGTYLEEPASVLNVTPTGQVATSLRGETVRSLNSTLAEQLSRVRAPVSADVVRRRAGVSAAELPAVQRMGELAREGYRIEKILLTARDGVSLPVLVFVPGAAGARRPAVISLNSQGKSRDAGDDQDPAALARLGRVVIAPDLRGWGETAGRGGTGSYSAAYQTSMRALLVGRSMLGMQVQDLLNVFAYTMSREDVDAGDVSLLAKQQAGPVALIAALLEPRIARVACEGSIVSFEDYARAKYPAPRPNLILPGVLRDFDLPQVAAALRPRPVWLVAPVLPSGARSPLEPVRATYRQAPNVRVVERPGGWPFSVMFKDWMSR